MIHFGTNNGVCPVERVSGRASNGSRVIGFTLCKSQINAGFCDGRSALLLIFAMERRCNLR